MNLIILCMVVALAFYVWLREYRAKKVVVAELRIARSVEEMQDLLLAGDIVSGDASHDVAFKVMEAVMIRRRYSLPWNVLRKSSRPFSEYEERLRRELEKENCPFSEILRRFSGAYYKAFRYKHPFQWVTFPLYLGFLNITARGVLATCITTYHLLFHFSRLRAYVARSYAVAGGSRELAAA